MKLRKIALAAAATVVLFSTGLKSCFAYPYFWEYPFCPLCCNDKISSEPDKVTGCSSCNGGSSESPIVVDATKGTATPSFSIPGFPISANQRRANVEQEGVSGLNIESNTKATLNMANGACTFRPSNTSDISQQWVSDTVPGLVMQPTNLVGGVITTATITEPNGKQMTFSHLDQKTYTRVWDSSTVAKYHLPETITDPQGKVATYTLDRDSQNTIPDGMPTSVELPDGSTYSYGYDSSGMLSSVTYPDGNAHMLIEGGLWPTQVSIVDTTSQTPEDPSVTTYTYNGCLIDSVTGNNHIKTKVTYDFSGDVAKVQYVRVMDDPDYVAAHPSEYPQFYTPQVYSQTKYSYDTVDIDDDDIADYGRTTIRQCASTGSVDYPGWDSDWADKIVEHWYYRDAQGNNSFIYKKVALVYENFQLVPLHTTVYNRNMTTPGNWNYGNIASAVSIDYENDLTKRREKTTTYDYYDPDLEYDVTTSPDSAPYDEVISGGVAGNGMLRQATLTINSTSFSTANNYKVLDGVMTSFTTIEKDYKGKTAKYVVNADGSTAEVWHEVDSQLVKTGSYTYYTTPDTHKGMLHTSTVYGVATQGTNKDQVTTYSYSYLGGTLTTTATCEGKTTESCYDALGQLMWSEDEHDRRTNYDYDWKGRSTTTTYPLVTGESTRKTRVNDYGGCCYLTSVTDEEGNAVHYGYNTKGTMIKQWADVTGQSEQTPLVEYDYSGVFGRLVNITTRKNSTDTAVINYEYDDLGRVDKINYYPQGMEATLGSEEYLYDQYGRLAAVKDGDGKIAAYEYDYLDRVVKIDYNYLGTFALPIAIPASDPDGSIVSYTYDDSVIPTDRVATVTEVIDTQSVTSSYSYDGQGRLISYTPALPAGYGSITYTWGLQGQKTSMTVPMGNSSAKRYTYHYDREGKQIGMNTEIVTCTSNPTLSAGTSDTNTRFFYNNSRNRVKLITKSGSAYYFVYDPTASIPAVVYEATGTTAYMNTREPSGALISREKYVSGVYQYSRTYHFDGLGSTIALTDENGVTTDTYSYDAWGNVTHTSGTTADNPYQYVGKLGYYTHYQEPTLNLLQLGVRYYDPSTGRFTQPDPAKDGNNYYIYSGSSPIIWTDPTGLYIKGNGAASCGTLPKLIKKASDILNNNATCIAALTKYGGTHNGFTACMKMAFKDNGQPPLIEVDTNQILDAKNNPAGLTDPSRDAIIVKSNGLELSTLIHEAVHYCRFKQKLFITDAEVQAAGWWNQYKIDYPDRAKAIQDGIWTCDHYCHRTWGKQTDPYPYIYEEMKAEDITHACMGN
ncbi:MAG: RHS repeat-associated core domain-containing protein [Armatimonadota bacterium]